MSPFLTFSYWTSLTPPPFTPMAVYVLLAFFGLVLASGFAVWGVAARGNKRKLLKRALGRAASHLAWTGFTGLLLVLFAYEEIPLLSMRAAYPAWFIWFAIGIVLIARYIWKDIPSLEGQQRERAELQKWLPKRK